MKLISLSYSEYKGTAAEWSIDQLDLEDINLLVGKNAVGKTRAINIIATLARLLSGRISIITNGNFQAKFENSNTIFEYFLNIKDQDVISEKFFTSEKVFLERGTGGIGKIYSQKEDETIDFQMPPNQVAAATRRDQINHPFFEPLYSWGISAYRFEFSSTLGRNSIAFQTEKTPIFDPYADTNQVIRAFNEGQKKHGDKFKKQVLEDFNSIGFELEDIFLHTPVVIKIQTPLPGQPICLWVKEKG